MLDETHSHRRRALAIALLAVIVIFILWNLPQWSDTLLYPFRLFVTYVHEAGHGTAALITGGRFIRFDVQPNGMGQAITQGGSRLLILPAGYLGAALFGAVLFYLTNSVRYSRTIAFVLGGGLIAFSVLFGLSSPTAFFVGVAFGAILILLGWKANRDFNILVLNVLAMMTGLNAVLDLYQLVGSSQITAGGLRNDAAAFSAEIAPLIPAGVWAFLWALLAVTMLGLAVWYAVIRPLRRK
jgi:hypothetical protein